MDSNTWNWKEALKKVEPYFKCKTCGLPIIAVSIDYFQGSHSRPTHVWAHKAQTANHQVEPVYHLIDTNIIEMLGFQNGMDGALLLDNPFCPRNPLYDGADSMGEAQTWWSGWHKAQVQLGKIVDEDGKPVGNPPPNGFDFLEAQRG